MRYKFILIILFFVAVQLKAANLPDLPQGAIPIRLNVEYMSPKSATYPIKRQPGAGVFLYLYGRTLFVPDLGEPYSIYLIDGDGVVVYSMDIMAGMTFAVLPENLTGSFLVRLNSALNSFSGEIDLE